MSTVKDLKKLKESVLGLKRIENKIYDIEIQQAIEFSKVKSDPDNQLSIYDFIISALYQDHVKDYIFKNARILAEEALKNEIEELKKIIEEVEHEDHVIG